MAFKEIVFSSTEFTCGRLTIPLNIQILVNELKAVSLEFFTHRVGGPRNHVSSVIRSNKWNHIHFFHINFSKFDQIDCGRVFLDLILFVHEHVKEVLVPQPVVEPSQQH